MTYVYTVEKLFAMRWWVYMQNGGLTHNYQMTYNQAVGIGWTFDIICSTYLLLSFMKKWNKRSACSSFVFYLSPPPSLSVTMTPLQLCLYYRYDNTSPCTIIRGNQLMQHNDFTSAREKVAVTRHAGTWRQVTVEVWPGHMLAVSLSMTEQTGVVNSVEFNQHSRVTQN